MKKLVALVAIMFAGGAFAIDNEGWLAKARECVEAGRLLDSDETDEDGIYCIALAEISQSEGKSVRARVGEAELEAKRKLTAFVHGETMTASRSVESRSSSVSSNGEKSTQSSSEFKKKISSKVNALVRGTKIIGQVSVKETSYVVCLTTERFEDDTAILKAAQAEYGNEGVVKSVGEAASHEAAVQKAIRGAVEQVLGTVVVGYDKMSSDSEFQKKVFSGSDGVVENYRILTEKDIDMGLRVEIVAKVSTKTLLDNYSNYMKFLGDPEFFIASNSPDLTSHFSEFFSDMGIRVTESPSRAKFVIECNGDYRSVKNPMNGRKGVQLSLRFKVKNAETNELLIDFKNDPKKSACFQTGGEDRQREICSDKAFAQMKDPLHEKIQAMVAKLVGRKMDEAAND